MVATLREPTRPGQGQERTATKKNGQDDVGYLLTKKGILVAA
jgi:hypothetical protein